MLRAFATALRGDHAVPARRIGPSRATPGGLTVVQTKGAPVAQVGIRELLEAGVHFGHQTRRWNPKMRRFIHGERGGIYIIDLLKTRGLLAQAQEFASELAHRGGTVLFVGHEEAGARRDQGSRRSVRHAVRQPPLARRAAHELPDDHPAHQAPARPRALRDRGPARRCCRRASGWPPRPTCAKLQANLGGVKNMQRVARRDVRRRPQDRGDRRARGAAPADPDHRAGRHQLRPRRHRLRDPRQRRRDPLVRA